MPDITFGTDGWRGIIADDFTYGNLGKVALATARFFKKHPKIEHGLVVGGDGRFGSQDFARYVAQVIATQGIKVLLAEEVVSTPMVSLGIIRKGAAGGVMITASHNPPQWNGFKIKGDFGGSAVPADIHAVEKQLAKVVSAGKEVVPKDYDALLAKGLIKPVNLKSLYFTDIRRKINLNAIKKSRLKIVFDSMYGSAVGLMQELLPDVVCIHDEYNPGFMRTPPEPLAKNLEELMSLVKSGEFNLGLVTDGDADRLGAVDEDGNFISTQVLMPLLLKYLYKVRRKKGVVVKTVSVTDIIPRMCHKYGLKLLERPVGFKFITEVMTEQTVLIGGEESGGVGTSFHIPERDGIYNCLLLCEMLAKSRKSLGAAIQDLFVEFGRMYYDRVDFHTTEKKKNAILRRCEKGFEEIADMTVLSTETLDGYKFRVDGGWLLIRASGTEPILRFYAEANTREKVDQLLQAAIEL